MCVRILPRLGYTFSLFALVLIVAATVSAYTVVLSDGRHLEIPARFELTPSTLTYEVSPGIQITIQLAAIDVAATEKANSESAGSFLKRATAGSPAAPVRTQRATRTITNRDLEPTAERRRSSELAYENRRRELGLPSVEESRRRAEEESAVVSAELQQRKAVESENEGYWRARASELRTEIVAADAELNVVRRQLEDSNYTNTTSSFTTVINAFPFGVGGGFGGGRGFGGFHQPRPGIFVAPPAARNVGGVITRGQVFQNPLTPRGFPRGGGPLIAPPNLALFSSGFGYDFGYERSELITRFNQLAATRATLNARWRELEDEARRAGAQPGWLRP
ncbi:MAG TPA: hypothetical protein VLL54_13695 [Pyrinomonadaceae bacterium]|nr:hypothetical protein [Pyrinomonadaceae bacterium]